MRTIDVLEQMGHAEARELLVKLGKSTPEARLTNEAQAALKRIHQRQETD